MYAFILISLPWLFFDNFKALPSNSSTCLNFHAPTFQVPRFPGCEVPLDRVSLRRPKPLFSIWNWACVAPHRSSIFIQHLQDITNSKLQPMQWPNHIFSTSNESLLSVLPTCPALVLLTQCLDNIQEAPPFCLPVYHVFIAVSTPHRQSYSIKMQISPLLCLQPSIGT